MCVFVFNLWITCYCTSVSLIYLGDILRISHPLTQEASFQMQNGNLTVLEMTIYGRQVDSLSAAVRICAEGGT